MKTPAVPAWLDNNLSGQISLRKALEFIPAGSAPAEHVTNALGLLSAEYKNYMRTCPACRSHLEVSTVAPLSDPDADPFMVKCSACDYTREPVRVAANGTMFYSDAELLTDYLLS